MKSIWGNLDVSWTSKKASGMLGGLLIFWNPKLFVPLFSFQGEGFFGIQLAWKDLLIYVVNVNSSCYLLKKNEF